MLWPCHSTCRVPYFFTAPSGFLAAPLSRVLHWRCFACVYLPQCLGPCFHVCFAGVGHISPPACLFTTLHRLPPSSWRLKCFLPAVQVLVGRLPCLVCPLRLLVLHTVLPLAGACLPRVLLHIRTALLRSGRCRFSSCRCLGGQREVYQVRSWSYCVIGSSKRRLSLLPLRGELAVSLHHNIIYVLLSSTLVNHQPTPFQRGFALCTVPGLA